MLGVIYARYSEGPHQTERSIEGQVADCRAYAEKNGIEIIEIYADRKISGKSVAGRMEFQRMLHDADLHRFQCVLVWKIDRFGRNREDIALGKRRLKQAGVRLLYAKESVPDGPEGIILESLLEGMAEYYSADLRQKVLRGIRETAKKGEYCGAPLPLGYMRDADRHIVIDPEKADAVQEAFRMYIAGAKLRELLEMFQKRGIVGQRGRPITMAVIHRMLRNERYLGRFELAGVEIPAEPILDQATFEAAAERFGTSHNNAAGRAAVEYLLSCKCFCGYCGAMLNGESGRGKGGKMYHYYKCGAKKRGAKCALKPVPQEELEEKVIRSTVEDMLTEETIEELTDRILKIQDEDEARDPAGVLRQQLDANRKRQRNVLAAIEEGTGARGLAARLADLEAEEADLEAELAHAEIKRPRLTRGLIQAWLYSFRDGDVTDPAFRRRLVETFVARIELKNGEAMIFYNIQEKGPSRGVRVRSVEWTRRNRTRTPQIRVVDGYIIMQIAI